MPDQNGPRRGKDKSSGGTVRTRSAGSKSDGSSADSNAESAHPHGDDSPPPGVDKAMYAAIHLAVASAVTKEFQALRDEIKSLHSKFDDIISQEITPLKSRLSDVADGLTHASDTITHIEKSCLPAITQHIASLTQANHHEILKMDAHRRKWNVIFHGIDGPAAQDETATRNDMRNFAKSVLKLSQDDINDTRFSACHRLSKKKDAGVIVRFSDLSDRDKWLMGAKNIQSYLAALPPHQQGKKISMSIDLPPLIRPLKNELMQKRRELPLERKRKSKLRYLTQYPFVELRIEDEPTLRPSVSLTDITKSTLGLDLNMKMPVFGNGG